MTASTIAAADEVGRTLGLAPGAVRSLRAGELIVEVMPGALPGIADTLTARLGARLSTLFATDDREAGEGFGLHHVWSVASLGVFLRVSTAVESETFQSIASRHPSANWFEREIHDVFGLTAEGHPNPYPVAVHDDWPDGTWILRKDVAGDRPVARTGGSTHPFRPVTGEGVFHIPVGPVHAGVIEPGHFRFGVAGEPVLYLQLRLFYVHKGIEKRFERLPWRHGLHLAQSISGDTAVGHALAYAHALERIASVEVPARARMLRVVLLELERVYNHVADIGAIATDVAFTVPASYAQALREDLLRVQERAFGSRTLRGTVALGGVTRDLTRESADELRRHLRTLRREFDDLVTMLIDAGTFTDRVDGTGVLPPQAARDLGVVGVAGRASGIDADLRRDHPHDAYGDVTFEVPVEAGGDVRARLMVRARETVQSLSILEQALGSLPGTATSAAFPDALPAGSALGWAEAWRGPAVHWVASDGTGKLARVKVTDPSFLNWPGLALSVPGNIVPDFPVINKSFNLSYSGNDR
jgi:Ni,Fe-hydrogenase III large subunit/Ni,Fe-hydrogenase III component G